MKAFFFDMDGVLFDSMKNHATAWEEVMAEHGMVFTQREVYLHEGMTGEAVVKMVLEREGKSLSDSEVETIYKEKSARFHSKGEALPVAGMPEFVQSLVAQGDVQLWVVTGSGQQSLFDKLEQAYPGAFVRERMVTAYDVTKGKPDPEPYLRAWERSGLKKEECCVIENAPMGVQAAKAAGLSCIAVNTGPLPDTALAEADVVIRDAYWLSDIRFEFVPNTRRAVLDRLKDCREERRPYWLKTGTMRSKLMRRILVPVSRLEEETYKAEICTWLARKTGAHLILLQAKDYGSRAKQNVDRIVTRIKKVSEATGTPISYEVVMAMKDSDHLMQEAAERQRDFQSDLIVLTASREYGLDDIVFGPQEYHAIRRAEVPVMLVNPREDLFSLCD